MKPVVSAASPQDRPLGQARLDRIACPTATYHDLYPRWLKALEDRERFPSAEIKQRLQDVVGPRLCRLRRLVVNPPDGMTAEAWETIEQELQETAALFDALTLELELRAGRRRAGPRAWTVRKAEASPLPVMASQDPFASE